MHSPPQVTAQGKRRSHGRVVCVAASSAALGFILGLACVLSVHTAGGYTSTWRQRTATPVTVLRDLSYDSRTASLEHGESRVGLLESAGDGEADTDSTSGAPAAAAALSRPPQPQEAQDAADKYNTKAFDQAVAGIVGVPGDRSSLPEYTQVVEDFLPENGYHQEGGVCQIGAMMYLVGGIATTQGQFEARAALGEDLDSSLAHAIDLDTLTVTQLPSFPVSTDHLACAASPDDVIHVTGGFTDKAVPPVGNSTSPRIYSSWRHHWTLDTKHKNATWQSRASMPGKRGAQGCAFLADGKMYCTGGGTGQWGPFLPNLFIYNPADDTWAEGPGMHVGRDHVAVLPIMHGARLLAVGGRSDIQRQPHAEPHPIHWQTMNTMEVFDPVNATWQYRAGVPVVKAGPAVVAIERRAGAHPNVLVIGGENHLGMSGIAYSSIEEYDVERGSWHCHAPLPFPVFGGAAAIWKDKLYVVAGGEWFGVAATRRLQIVDLAAAPEPRPCAYLPQRMYQPWERHFMKSIPWPGVLADNDGATALQDRVKDNYGYSK